MTIPEPRTCHFILPAVLLLFVFGVQAEQQILTSHEITLEDGDTLLIQLEGEQHRIQLKGIDAPEDVDNPKLQSDLNRSGLDKERLLKLGQQSTAQLRSLTLSDAPYTLHYEPARRDRYGRLIGDILNARGDSLATLMVKTGYAIVSVRSSDPEQLTQLEPLQQQAIEMKKGLWGLDKDATSRWAGIKTSD